MKRAAKVDPAKTRTVFKVRTPSGVYADGEWGRREDVPEKLPDRFEHYFDTAEYVEEVPAQGDDKRDGR